MSGIALHTHARTVQRNGPTTAVCIKAKSCPDIKQRDRDSQPGGRYWTTEQCRHCERLTTIGWLLQYRRIKQFCNQTTDIRLICRNTVSTHLQE